MKVYRVEKDDFLSGLNFNLSVHIENKETCKPASKYDRCAFSSLSDIFNIFPKRDLICASVYEIEVKNAEKCGWHLSFSEDDIILYRQISYSEIVSHAHDFVSEGEKLFYDDDY